MTKDSTRSSYVTALRTCLRRGDSPDEIATQSYVDAFERKDKGTKAGIKWFCDLYQLHVRPKLSDELCSTRFI